MQKLLDEADKLGYWAMTAWIDSDNDMSIKFLCKRWVLHNREDAEYR